MTSPCLALIKRDLLRTLRRPSAFCCLAVFVLALGAVALIPLVVPGMSVAVNGLGILEALLRLVAIAVLPALGVLSIAEERRGETLEQVRLTQMRTPAFVLAKITNAAAFYCILCIATLPVFASFLFPVGINVWQIPRTVFAIIGVAIVAATAGVSAGCSRGELSSALSLAYGIILAWLFAHHALTQLPLLLAYSFSSVPNPLASLLDIVLVSLLLFQAIASLDRKHKKFRDTLFGHTGVPRAKSRFRKRYSILAPLRRRAERSGNWNPVVVREIRYATVSRTPTMLRIFNLLQVVFWAITSGLIWAEASPIADIFATGAIIQIMCILLLAPAHMIPICNREHAADSWDMLRMTTLTPREIVKGRLVAGCATAIPVACAPLLAYLLCFPFVLGHRGGPALLLASLLLVLFSLWLSTCISLYCGVSGKSLATQIVFAYVLNAVVFVILMSVFPIPYAFETLAPHARATNAFATPRGGYGHDLQTFLIYDWHRLLSVPGLLISFSVLGWVFYVLSAREFRRTRLCDR